MNNNTYKHTDFSGDFISLHECTVDGISYENGILTLTFDGGFLLKTTHHANKTEKNLRTDKAQVSFVCKEAPAIFIFKKNLFGKMTKKELPAESLCELAGGSTALEILGLYPADGKTLIKCWARDKKTDKVSECHIELSSEKAFYRW